MPSPDHHDARAARPHTGRAVAASPTFTAQRPWKLWIGVAALVGVLTSLGSLVAPRETAQANIITDAGDWVAEKFGDAAGSAGVAAFAELLEFLFGGVQAKITAGLLKWLVGVTDFTASEFSVNTVTRLEHKVELLAFSLMTLIAMFAFLRYWLAGMSFSSPGLAGGMDVVGRCVLASVLILAWPLIFHNVLALTNSVSAFLIGSQLQELSGLIKAAVLVSVAGAAFGSWFFAIAMAVVGLLALLGLLLLKIMLIAVTHILFVAMPLALVVWPHPELAWITRTVASGFLACMLIPIGWALLFASAAAMSFDALPLTPDDSRGLNEIIKPLVGLAMLLIAARMPMMMIRMLPLGQAAPGNGMLGRSMSYALGRTVSAGMTSKLGERAPGLAARVGLGPQTTVSQTDSFDSQGRVASRTERTTRGTEAGMKHAAAQASPTSAVSASASGQSSPGGASGNAPVAAYAGNGMARGSQARYEDGQGLRVQDFHQPSVQAGSQAEYRASLDRPTATPQQTSAALGQFTASQQAALRDMAKAENPRGEFSSHAADSGYTPTQREAFRVLASSDPGVVRSAAATPPGGAPPLAPRAADATGGNAVGGAGDITPTQVNAAGDYSPSATEAASVTVAAAPTATAAGDTAVTAITPAAPAGSDGSTPAINAPAQQPFPREVENPLDAARRLTLEDEHRRTAGSDPWSFDVPY